MVPSDIFNGMEITNIADEVQRMELTQKMLQTASEQTSFTGNDPSASSPSPSVETAGGTIAFRGDTENAGGMGIAKPDLKTSFAGNTETAGGIAFQGNSDTVVPVTETDTRIADILSPAQVQRRRGESLVNEAHILDHKAMIARTQGDYAKADELQRDANSKQKEGYDILENLQLGKLGLDKSEQSWTQKALKQEKITPDMAHEEISFGASVTCWGGRTVCIGCAGPLIDEKIGCKCGACSGGTRLS